jgi:DNA-binding PadR family transcriptional regulator
MAPRAIDVGRSQPRGSAVQWGLLGLVIERPSYGYELATRFDRAYGGELRLSSTSYAYTALNALKEHGLVEEVSGAGSDRQPKPIYRPTTEGVAAFQEHLIAEASDEDRRRVRIWTRKLTAFAREPEIGLALIGRIREAYLKEGMRLRDSPALGDGTELEPGRVLAARLAAEERRLVLDAMLSWLEIAERELRALAAQAPGK